MRRALCTVAAAFILALAIPLAAICILLSGIISGVGHMIREARQEIWSAQDIWRNREEEMTETARQIAARWSGRVRRNLPGVILGALAGAGAWCLGLHAGGAL